jgi:hypothetical protein
MKNSFFYNTADIQRMKELIRTGEPIAHIAKREHASFNAKEKGFLMKLYQLSKTTRKIKKWEGPKRVRQAVAETTTVVEPQGIAIPEGVSLDLTSKRVVLFDNHVRIYF